MSVQNRASKWKLWSLVLLPFIFAADAPTTRPKIFKAKDPSRLKLAIITNNASDFWKMAKAGVAKYEKESGSKIEFDMPANGRASDQTKLIDRLVADGIDGIAVATVDPENEAKYLRDIGSKTNLICFDVPCPDADAVLTIAADNEAAGELVGKHVAELLPDGGEIAVVSGLFKSKTAAARLEGIKKAVKDHHIEVVAEVEDDKDMEKCVSATKDMLSAHPDVRVVVGLFSYEGRGIAEAVNAGGMEDKVKVIAFDQERATLDGIEHGKIESTFAFDPFDMGYQTAKWLHDLAVDGDEAKLPKGNAVDLNFRKVDKTNLAEFRKKVDEIQPAK